MTEPPLPSAGKHDPHQMLVDIANMKMPFGRYAGTRLIDLPEPYIVWFSQQGFPEGKLGVMLQTLYEIKLNGLEYLFKDLKKTAEGDPEQ